VTDDSGMEELSACGAADCPWYNMTAVAQRPTDNAVMCTSFVAIWHKASFSQLSVLNLANSFCSNLLFVLVIT